MADDHPKVAEARDALKQLGFPRAQHNMRSALTLLALLRLGPDDPWRSASAPLRGITQMMGFFAELYGQKYAANTRETVRRDTVHQFVRAGLALANPDRPDRPTNSGKTVYQVSEDALRLLRTYGSGAWKARLDVYLASHPRLKDSYEGRKRGSGLGNTPMRYQLAPSVTVEMSPGDHGKLLRAVCTEFVARFVRGARILYVGDTAKRFAYMDRAGLEDLRIVLDRHGKIPDVIMYDVPRGWLFLVEAVTSHGPIDPKRRFELEDVFSDIRPNIVYVTAFASKEVMRKYVTSISWETEVWIAESPDHMIHFDGEKFLGPHG